MEQNEILDDIQEPQEEYCLPEISPEDTKIEEAREYVKTVKVGDDNPFYDKDGTPIKKRPKATRGQMREMVAELSGLHREVVGRVIKYYYDVVEKLLLNGIEVPFSDMGVLTFLPVKEQPAGKRWNPSLKQYVDSLPKPAYCRVKFKPNKNFSGRLYWASCRGEIPTLYAMAEWCEEKYGEKSPFSEYTPEKMASEQRERERKIATRGGAEFGLEDKWKVSNEQD